MDEEPAGQHRPQINASRHYLPEEIPTLEQSRLGEVESEDISEITAVGVLEVAPLHAADGWLLRVRIEDTRGRRLPEDTPASDQPEEIDLATFQEAFIVPERGTAFVAVAAMRYRRY